MILQIVTFVVVMLSLTIYYLRHIKQPKAAILYSSLMGVCIIVGILTIAKVYIPSTTIVARTLFEPLGKFILQQ
ncbi:hypothetical protein [Paenibacillus gorillae]|uniref:hypothetical protein n=1 Tax=Paenibacillus gorillae TaxID=1243662 RepID=UPI0004B07854|nr:hypothetical protein [Paenibacillus gorillae]